MWELRRKYEEEQALRQQDAQYPVWRGTDWTLSQRRMAIRGLLLLTLGCWLLAGCLAQWRSASLAVLLLAPIGMTLLCLGITHLNMLYWYAYLHGATTVGERLRLSLQVSEFARLEMVVDRLTMGAQIVGASLAAIGAWGSWWLLDPFILAWLMAAPTLMGFVANAVSFILVMSGRIGWRPRRDPTQAAMALTPPASGIRLVARWLVMGVNAMSLPLVIVPAFNLSDRYGMLAHGDPPDPALLSYAALYALAALFFLLAALSELTHRG